MLYCSTQKILVLSAALTYYGFSVLTRTGCPLIFNDTCIARSYIIAQVTRFLLTRTSHVRLTCVAAEVPCGV